MGLAALFAACHDEEESPQIPITVRTVFMYLVADNDISGDIYNNIAIRWTQLPHIIKNLEHY